MCCKPVTSGLVVWIWRLILIGTLLASLFPFHCSRLNPLWWSPKFYAFLLQGVCEFVSSGVMAATIKQMSIIVATLGTLSFMFGVIAENKKVLLSKEPLISCYLIERVSGFHLTS